jgi:hypothetical protein
MRRLAAFVTALLAGIAIVAAATPVEANLWSLATGRGFFIPAESSVFSFRVTKMNEGSGEWWLYGEDNQNLFALHPSEPVYVSAVREVQSRCSGFDASDFSTWCSSTKHSVPGE